MTTPPAGSTIPRRRLGRELESARLHKGWSRKTAAAKLEISDAKLWRLENGLVSSQPMAVRLICHVYGLDEHLTEALVALARVSRDKGWWHQYGDIIPEWFEVYVGLETAAAELLVFEPSTVPGILQSPGYAEAIYRGPGSVATDEDDVVRRVEVRMHRQEALSRPDSPLQVRAFLSEAILRTPVGGPKVIAEQLDHLNTLGELPNVRIRVVPFEAGVHGGMIMIGSTSILRFPEEHDPDTVYIQVPTGGLYLDQPNQVAKYDILFADLATRSPDEAESREMIARAAREYHQ